MRELYGATDEITKAFSNHTSTTYSLDTTLILTVSVDTGVIKYIDYYDGYVQLDAVQTSPTFTFRRSTRSKVADVETKGTYTSPYDAMVQAVGVLVPRRPTAAILHIEHWGFMVKDDRFIDRSRYEHPVLETGEVGRAAGLAIVRADHAYPGALLVLEPKRDKWFILKRELEMKKKNLEEADAYAFYFYQEYWPKVTRDDGICLVFNAAEKSRDITI